MLNKKKGGGGGPREAPPTAGRRDVSLIYGPRPLSVRPLIRAAIAGIGPPGRNSGREVSAAAAVHCRRWGVVTLRVGVEGGRVKLAASLCAAMIANGRIGVLRARFGGEEVVEQKLSNKTLHGVASDEKSGAFGFVVRWINACAPTARLRTSSAGRNRMHIIIWCSARTPPGTKAPAAPEVFHYFNLMTSPPNALRRRPCVLTVHGSVDS
ncbi:hypothetical protein EVAR_37756_1 [Eumeta japonica]|uniref:Uncharacterized protein n=1 Tax=Eumeta variegata TaxID=151549 RepID=A0A4C1WPV9_EUMVA|nr:hypothetical protein EVAR_37756_1 [Eumeta japonica]